MLQPQRSVSVCESVGAIGRSVVGEDGLEVDTEAGIVGQRCVHEGQYGGGHFIRVNKEEGDA